MGDYGKKEPKSCPARPAQAIQRSCVPEIVLLHRYPSGDWLDSGFLRHCNFRCVRLLFSCCPTEKPHDRDFVRKRQVNCVLECYPLPRTRLTCILPFENCNFETLVCDWLLRILSLIYLDTIFDDVVPPRYEYSNTTLNALKYEKFPPPSSAASIWWDIHPYLAGLMCVISTAMTTTLLLVICSTRINCQLCL